MVPQAWVFGLVLFLYLGLGFWCWGSGFREFGVFGLGFRVILCGNETKMETAKLEASNLIIGWT